MEIKVDLLRDDASLFAHREAFGHTLCPLIFKKLSIISSPTVGNGYGERVLFETCLYCQSELHLIR